MKVIEFLIDLLPICLFFAIMIAGAYFFPSSFLGSLLVGLGASGFVSQIVFKIGKRI